MDKFSTEDLIEIVSDNRHKDDSQSIMITELAKDLMKKKIQIDSILKILVP